MELPETVAIFKRWKAATFKNVTIEEDPKDWRIPVAAVGLLVVILGIGAETIFEALTSNSETAVRNHDEQKVVEATTKAGEARDSAKAAVGFANDAQMKEEGVSRRADRLDGRMGVASTKLDKLEGRLAWRRIDPHRFKKFVDTLSPFAGSSAFVDIEGNGDEEVRTFGEDILKLLSDAHWKTSVSRSNIRMPPIKGLTCRVNIDSDAGKALAGVLETFPGASMAPVHARGGARGRNYSRHQIASVKKKAEYRPVRPPSRCPVTVKPPRPEQFRNPRQISHIHFPSDVTNPH